ncbi:MAG: SDR family oxidoreductase [Opitutaceae bacterium]|nr:SDR family oxidoreductase [Cephaloticoccus sp.]MCP5531066.1 SDR family oxidoreductase [Opitutaceae bacterium]
MRIVISGTSSGIGRAIAGHLLNLNHEVWGLARSDQASQAASHPRFHPVVCDVTDPESIQAAIATVSQSTCALDAVITCAAAHGPIGPAMQSDPKAWCDAVDLNLGGTLRVLQAFHPFLIQAEHRGKIVCFSGGGATKARPGFSAYAAAKTGIVRLVETIAVEERGSPLDINAVAPGAIRTRLIDEVLALGPATVGEKEYQSALQAKADSGAALTRAINLVLWLISRESDGLSGKLFSAQWDSWPIPSAEIAEFAASDLLTLRRNTTLRRMP